MPGTECVLLLSRIAVWLHSYVRNINKQVTNLKNDSINRKYIPLTLSERCDSLSESALPSDAPEADFGSDGDEAKVIRPVTQESKNVK